MRRKGGWELSTNANSRLRWIALALCAPSGASLLVHLFGSAPLSATVPFVVLPSLVGLVVVAWLAVRRGDTDLAHMLQVGLAGGLVGTIAYDLYRVPFQWAGHRVFVPIQIYGIWILDAHSSTPLTDLVGRLYHFSNGITFGIAYALCVPGRHWIGGIVWGLILETIALVTPFGRIFALRGNVSALAIAYTGHIAYGLPLGWLTHRWQSVAQRIQAVPRSLYRTALALGAAALCVVTVSAVDNSRPRDRFTIESTGINPDILRVEHGDLVSLYNPGGKPRVVDVPAYRKSFTVRAGRAVDLGARRTGIFQIRLHNVAGTRSSFLVVEPVSDGRQ